MLVECGSEQAMVKDAPRVSCCLRSDQALIKH
jgi:hypothetical protein